VRHSSSPVISAFISFLPDWGHRISGKFLARKIYFAGPPSQIDRAASDRLAKKLKVTRRTVQRVGLKRALRLMIRRQCRYGLKTTELILAAQSLHLASLQQNVLGPALLFAERWDETHFLELGEQAEQHFLRVHPLQETVPARFRGTGHDLVLKVED